MNVGVTNAPRPLRLLLGVVLAVGLGFFWISAAVQVPRRPPLSTPWGVLSPDAAEPLAELPP